ncbi:hypothetical protein [Thermobifida cellulosilytica]|uniref:Uncharacterized protein n=1 Tax=Thermobifida cellulosilytica TB100 TaxID=665004 RepID=A0A147KHK7_THECS|nr:hypothetical protein [Thermobifida cellulosilytica]KUP96659.1 hypothetical protein AC529_11000 [Thermobifida cellulosilytica TB100]
MSHYPDPHGGPGSPWNAGQGLPGPVPPYESTGGYSAPLPAVPEQPIAVIGDITVTQNTVVTPGGSFPLRGSMWAINDMTTVQQGIPTWATVLAVLGFFLVCALSLLLLLVKETTVTGTIQVTVTYGDRFYTTQVPVRSPADITRTHQQFNYVRSLTF